MGIPVMEGRPPGGEPVRVTATRAKNEFGDLLEKAIQGEVVVITRHDHPKAVLLSLAAYQALAGQAQISLGRLSDEFDALLGRMQTPRARAGMKAAFAASPQRLGRAAMRARKRGRAR